MYFLVILMKFTAGSKVPLSVYKMSKNCIEKGMLVGDWEKSHKIHLYSPDKKDSFVEETWGSDLELLCSK